jgi:hypothetical protein
MMLRRLSTAVSANASILAALKTSLNAEMKLRNKQKVLVIKSCLAEITNFG